MDKNCLAQAPFDRHNQKRKGTCESFCRAGRRTRPDQEAIDDVLTFMEDVLEPVEDEDEIRTTSSRWEIFNGSVEMLKFAYETHQMNNEQQQRYLILGIKYPVTILNGAPMRIDYSSE